MPPVEQSPAPPWVAAELPPDRDDSVVPLRLAVTQGQLGIELYREMCVDPIRVTELSLALPGLKFPIDLGGGVPAFRHRRGQLGRVTLVLEPVRLARHFRQRLRDYLGAATQLEVWPLEEGIGVGMVGDTGALAFDVLFAPTLGEARFVVSDARAAGLSGPALGFALRALDTALGRSFERHGRIITMARAAYHVASAILPLVGARVPSVDGVNFGSVERYEDELSVSMDASYGPPAVTPRAARALELALLVHDADDAASRGDLPAAREGYVAALERAPRHPELARSVAEIDAISGNRAESALGMLMEALPVTRAGAFVADLLVEQGDRAAAASALSESMQRERYAPLAALCWARFAELAETAQERMRALDEAVARAPALSRVRFARFVERVRLSDVPRAFADAQHLEAAARGPRGRHEVCVRVAAVFDSSELGREAGQWYERALRYVPDDPAATAGLARALSRAGKKERAYALFERAVSCSEARGEVDADALADLALHLAQELNDLPQAIARVRLVPAASARAGQARYLEAKWRATVGDIAGASLAYARLRDTVELSGYQHVPARYLMDAANHELSQQEDLIAAERHLAVAMRVAPQDARVAKAYRDVAARIAQASRNERRRGRGEPGWVGSDDETGAGADPALGPDEETSAGEGTGSGDSDGGGA